MLLALPIVAFLCEMLIDIKIVTRGAPTIDQKSVYSDLLIIGIA